MNDKILKVKEWCKKFNVPEVAFVRAAEIGIIPPPFLFPSDDALKEFERIVNHVGN